MRNQVIFKTWVLQEVELQSWENWGEGDNVGSPFASNANNVQQQANRRPNTIPVLLNNMPEPDPEPDIDYFQDMTPRIKKAAKVFHFC